MHTREGLSLGQVPGRVYTRGLVAVTCPLVRAKAEINKHNFEGQVPGTFTFNLNQLKFVVQVGGTKSRCL